MFSKRWLTLITFGINFGYNIKFFIKYIKTLKGYKLFYNVYGF